jgi:hypothetical protein
MATVAATTVPASPPFAPGAFMWRKYGPLPVWGYAGIVLAGLLIFVWLRRGKAADQTATATATKDAGAVPDNQKSLPVFILPQSLPGPPGAAGPAGPAGPPGADATATTPAAPPGSGRSSTPGNPYVNADGTVSVGAGARLYDVAESVGLTGGQFAALNSSIWKTNTRWDGKDANGNLIPYAIRGMPYRIT